MTATPEQLPPHVESRHQDLVERDSETAPLPDERPHSEDHSSAAEASTTASPDATRTRATAPRPYQGPERRKSAPIPQTSTQIARAASSVFVVLALWTAVLLMVRGRGEGTRLFLLSLTHSVAGALLLIGAALSYAIWRSTNTTRAAGAAVALTAAGLATPLAGMLARSARSGLVDATAAGLLVAGVESAIIICLGAALRPPAVRAGLKPVRYAVPFAAAVVLGASFLLARGSAVSPAALGRTADILRIANVAGWVILAAILIIGGIRRRRPVDILTGSAFLLLAGDAAAAYRQASIDYELNVAGVAFDLAVASTIAATAAVCLWRDHTNGALRLTAMSSELRATRTDLAVLESSQDRRLHDARNAIFAIAGAVELLAHPTPRAALAPEHLQRLITAELSRLGHLLDPGFHSETSTFTAHDLLDPLIEAYRAHGLTITANLDDSVLTGRRELIAGAVTNILTNARVHAPGARIWVTSATIYDANQGGLAVRIDIADDGPGIPASQRDAVLLPGVRGVGVAAPGSGLGLASAAQALSEADGTLRLSERKGGGTMITLTLPSARSASHPG